MSGLLTLKTIYKFNELSETAKDRAREWYREGMAHDNYFAECVIDDAKEVGRLLGIEIENIYFSGFSSQGDGACFEGSYRYQKGAAKAVKEYTQDRELYRIARDLQAGQRRAFYGLSAIVSHSGRDSNEYCTDITVYHETRDASEEEEEWIAEGLRDFMRWIYRRLEAEWDYVNSDEAVDEGIVNNEYTFDEEGNRA